MAKVFISPSRYIQGPNELKQIGQYAKNLGSKALILISSSGKKRFGQIIEDSFSAVGCKCAFENFNGECSKSEIDRLTELVKDGGCDLVVGVGGGKIFDTAKAVAYYADTPVVICPTVASTDAPCSALSVVYTDEGVFQEYLFLKRNPDVVLVDTEVIAASPLRLTVSGMGDAMATYFEARACAAWTLKLLLSLELVHWDSSEKIGQWRSWRLVLPEKNAKQRPQYLPDSPSGAQNTCGKYA